MTKYAFADPATDAPEHALAFAAQVGDLPKREYAARKDHDHEYPAGEYVDASTDAAAQAAFGILSLVPAVTKKEAQFALGFHTPADVTRAANRWAKAHDGATDHQVVRPAPHRPVTRTEPTPVPEAPKPARKPRQPRAPKAAKQNAAA